MLLHESLREILVLALKFFLFGGPHKPGFVLGSGFARKSGSGYAALAIGLTVQYVYLRRLYKEKSIQCKTRDLAIADLNKYYIALDATIMKFHQEKMLVSGCC